MRRGTWSIQGSSTTSARSRRVSRPSPRKGAVTRARGRSGMGRHNGGTMTPASPLAVGIDIGSTSVKAVAADEDGNVVARTRVAHKLLSPQADQLEHDAGQAWRRGPRRALAAVDSDDVVAVSVTGMV